MSKSWVSVYHARAHNLKGITASFPQRSLVVITGVSGSGKSSLAFDTLYAEGQYRYAQTFSSYARGFLGDIRRPDVDDIKGLSPVISIDQKTGTPQARSTVGTSTELYDYLRVLYARVGIPYSSSGTPMMQQTKAELTAAILRRYVGKEISLLSPVVRSRKGHYRELFHNFRQQGYQYVRVDGEKRLLEAGMQLSRYDTHNVELYVGHFSSLEKKEPFPTVLEQALVWGKGTCIVSEGEEMVFFSTHLMDKDTGLSFADPAPNTFSFNSPQGACSVCKGLGFVQRLDMSKVLPSSAMSLAQGGITPVGAYTHRSKPSKIFTIVRQFLESEGLGMHTPVGDFPKKVLDRLLYGLRKDNRGKGVYSTEIIFEQEGVLGFVERMHAIDPNISHYRTKEVYTRTSCEACQGTRLKKEALCFRVHHQNIAEVSAYSLSAFISWIDGLPSVLNDRQQRIARDLCKELRRRTQCLLDLGLGYLTIDRPLSTLSGGEAQRTRLATQIGSQLVGVMYILDEPSIGLHARDSDRMIASLRKLRDLGNTVVVVEHDRAMMLASDWIVDLGPGAGAHGGFVVFEGEREKILQENSLTGQYLSGQRYVGDTIPSKKRDKAVSASLDYLELCKAKGRNLKSVNLRLPLGKMVCVSGVSGSGKSTLVSDTLVPYLKRHYHRARTPSLPHGGLKGLEHLDKIIEIDQKPIGRTSRSNPATYTGVMGDIRRLYASLTESQVRGYTIGRFSFNVKGGRCEHCSGVGFRVIEMGLLPSINVPCEECAQRRYNTETLEVRYKGYSIADILDLSIEDALRVFQSQPMISRKIQVMQDVGLGYVRLGQHATTLSGGEAQRMKLSSELLRKDTSHTLYVLDEPTTGLHFEDINKLIYVLRRLVGKGNTALIIEHNIELLSEADHIIDMGPEGGEQGGRIIAEGTPRALAREAQTDTGVALREYYAQKRDKAVKIC